MFKLSVAATVALACAKGPTPWNPETDVPMNGHYNAANPKVGGEPQPAQHRGTHYFEVVSPSYFSTYAEVNWGAFNVPLDPDVVSALDGKLVSFVGYEFDMVRTLPDNTTVSVPAWELYNHHYGNTIVGKATTMVKTNIPGAHEKVEFGDENERFFPGYKFVNRNPKINVRQPLARYGSGGLIIGNGAESRKTFHYFADGYGVLVDSPVSAAIHPMIIDTKNREGTGTPQRKTGHGIVPNSSTVGPDEMYSAIHECPCTDKWPKKISSFSTQETGTCNPDITTPERCFMAAVELGLHPVAANKTTSNAMSPPGCSVTALPGGYEILFNTMPKPSVGCGKPVNTPSGPPLNYTCNFTGTWVQIENARHTATFNFVPAGADKYNIMSQGRLAATMTAAAPNAAKPQGTVDGIWGTKNIPADVTTYSGAGSPTCTQLNWGNGVVFAKMPYASNPEVPLVPPRVGGTAEDLTNITLDIDSSKDLVTLTLEGPSDVWFGAGFGYHHVSTGGADPSVGVSMVGTNWTVVVLGDGTVQERRLGNHEPGVELPNTINVTSNTVVNGKRTVVLTRSVKGQTSDDYAFNPAANQITYINAVGSGPYLTVHKAKSSGVIYMLETDYPTCICDKSGDQGTIGGYSWGTQRCVARPLGQMLDDPKWASNNKINPSCDIHAYRGGLRCCKGGTIILDSDQNVTNNYVFEWQLKYRYYYEIVEDPSSVVETGMTSWWTEHNNGEHDVPKCKEGEECVYEITSNFTAGMFNGCGNGCQLITLEGHCHIGCIAMELWIVDDPEKPVLLCNGSVAYGTDDSWMNEMGYIAGNMNCIYGNSTSGYPQPIPLHPLTKLRSIKRSNNTNAYTGDMGLWEINFAPLPAGYVFPDKPAL